MAKLSEEVALRLRGCGVQGRTFTLKIKKRKSDAEEPIKYLGCGDCENLSHSITVPMATDDVDVFQRITNQLFGSFHLDVKDIRGMGLQVSKLEDADTTKQGSEKSSIRSWLLSASARTRDQDRIGCSSQIANKGGLTQFVHGDSDTLCSGKPGSNGQRDAGTSNQEDNSNQDVILPALHDLDIGVLECLPPEVLAEIDNMYGGEVLGLISKCKRIVHTSDVDASKPRNDRGGGHGSHSNFTAPSETLLVSHEIEGVSDRSVLEEQPVESSLEELREEENQGCSKRVQAWTSGMPDALSGNIGLIPSSLSQIDTSVLEQLPEDLRTDIVEFLPLHRVPESAPDVSLDVKNQTEPRGSSSIDDLWLGNPPQWIDKFKANNCPVLNMFSELYFKAGSSSQLSLLLQQAISDVCLHRDAATESRDTSASCLCELFKQYVSMKVETDIEEIYICFRLLQRLSSRSNFFLQIYDTVLPHLQASVGEIYGGNLCFSSFKK